MNIALASMSEATFEQPWEWLLRWSNLIAPPERGGWLAFVTREYQRTADDPAAFVAWKTVDDAACRAGFKSLLRPQIDEQAARNVLADALKHVRPVALPLVNERRIKSATELIAAAAAVGFVLEPHPKLDAWQRNQERRDHLVLIERSAGILQRYGRVYVGAACIPSVRAAADLVVVLDGGGLLLVEAMNVAFDVRSMSAHRPWVTKRRLAEAAAVAGMHFLFVGSPPPWVEVVDGASVVLEVPGGRWTTHLQGSAADRAPPSSSLVHYVADPEELGEDGALRVGAWLLAQA